MARLAKHPTPEEAAALRDAPGTTLALDLTAALNRWRERNDARVYRLTDGRVLSDDRWSPMIYASEANLLEFLSRDPRAHWDRPWHDRRGLDVGDCNYLATMIRAPLADVTARLAPLAAGHVPDALEQDVPAAEDALIAFQLEGHAWTVVLTAEAGGPEATVNDALLEGSRAVGWPLLEIGVSDTMCSLGYTLVENGATVERLEWDEGRPPVFESKRRSLGEEDAEDPRGFMSDTLAAMDVYVPHLLFATFVANPEPKARTWHVATPRLTVWSTSTEPYATTKPTFAGVSYLWFVKPPRRRP